MFVSCDVGVNSLTLAARDAVIVVVDVWSFSTAVTVALPPIFSKASQPPRAKPALSSTPSSVALISVRGKAMRHFWRIRLSDALRLSTSGEQSRCAMMR